MLPNKGGLPAALFPALFLSLTPWPTTHTRAILESFHANTPGNFGACGGREKEGRTSLAIPRNSDCLIPSSRR
jgi:hypothetical protein